MSLITRCPACGTMFKVVTDQLKISDGWVRCGHCGEIFDAASDLQEEAEFEPALPAASEGSAQASAQPPQVSPLWQAEEQTAAPTAPPPPEPAALDTEAQDDDFPSSIHSEVDESAIEGFADSQELHEHAQALRADPLDRPFEFRRADTPEDTPVSPLRQHRLAATEEPDLDDLSFVRQARRKAFWRRPAVRVGLVLMGLLLLALLALQMAWNGRERLAATEPELRPWLLKLCEMAGCTIGPPRRIESIAIDSSSFNKLRPDTYRLNVTLKNQAATEVAMPALELTLTDSQDQAVSRRVLMPAEFAGRTTTLLPGAEWSTSLAIAVNGGSASRVAGYRVLAFYP